MKNDPFSFRNNIQRIHSQHSEANPNIINPLSPTAKRMHSQQSDGNNVQVSVNRTELTENDTKRNGKSDDNDTMTDQFYTNPFSTNMIN